MEMDNKCLGFKDGWKPENYFLFPEAWNAYI